MKIGICVGTADLLNGILFTLDLFYVRTMPLELKKMTLPLFENRI